MIEGPACLSFGELYRLAEETREEMFQVLAAQAPESLDWRPLEHKNVKSVMYYLRHLCDAEHYWVDSVVGGRPFVRHASKDYPDLPAATRRMRDLRAATFRLVEGLDAGDLDRTFEGHGKRRTLRWVLCHILEHESHHKGQVYLLVRLRNPDAPPLVS